MELKFELNLLLSPFLRGLSKTEAQQFSSNFLSLVEFSFY